MVLPIKTQRLYIAEFTADMAESMHINSLDNDNRRFLPDEVFETVDEARMKLAELISYYSKNGAPLVYPVFLAGGRHIGHVQAVPIEDGWEIGYHVAKPFAGNGYATEAVGAFLPHIMRRLDISRIYGICRAENAASLRVLEKCGFELEFDGLAPEHGEVVRVRRYVYTLEKEQSEPRKESLEPEMELLGPEMGLSEPEKEPLEPRKELSGPEKELSGPEKELSGPEMGLSEPRKKLSELEKELPEPRIETSRLVLRPFRAADAPAVGRNSRQPAASRYIPDMVWDTDEDASAFIEWFNSNKFNTRVPHVILGIYLKSNRQCIGFAGVGPKPELDNEIELGYLISDEHKNRGYATEACKALIWWAFEQAKQDLLSAMVDPDNKASIRVLEKLGFVFGENRALPDGGSFDYFRLYHTDPLPGPEWDAQSLYMPERMGDFFDARAGGYDEHMLSGGGGDISYKKLGSFFPKTDEELKILDIGCGTGIELDYIWERAPNAHITCLDLSRGMLDLLLKNHPRDHAKISIAEASYTDWAYPENAYDIAVSSVTMHHLWPDEKIGVYKNIYRTLKPGGWYIEDDFIVDDMLCEQYKRRYEIITANLPEKAKAGEYHIDIPCTLDMQIKLLSGAGFGRVLVLDKDIKPDGSGAILKSMKN